MSQDAQEVSLAMPAVTRKLIDRGTFANLLLPVINKLPRYGSARLEGHSLTLPWMDPEQGPVKVVITGSITIGEVYSAEPGTLAFRIEANNLADQVHFHAVDGHAWITRLDLN